MALRKKYVTVYTYNTDIGEKLTQLSRTRLHFKLVHIGPGVESTSHITYSYSEEFDNDPWKDERE